MNKFINLFITFILIPVVIFSISYLHIYPQFSGEFTQYLGSIEVSYISMGQFILDNYPGSWQPLWYLGYPMYLIYLPVVPYIEVIAKVLFGFSPSHTYRLLTAASYSFTPISLYFLVYLVTKKKIGAVFSALFYATAPSLLAFFYNSIANDRFATSLVDPRRFTILVRWGEGPHIVALAFLPLAASFYYLFLARNRFRDLILATVFIGLTNLTNAIAVWGLLVLLFAITLEHLLKSPKEKLTVLKRVTKVALVSIGIIAFWYHPAFITAFFGEGGGTLSYWRGIFPWGIIGLIIGFYLYTFFLKKVAIGIRFLTASLTWFIIMFSLVYIYYSSGDDRIQLVPQVLRLNTEVDMALSLLLGILLSFITELLWKKNIIYKAIAIFIIIGAFTPLIIRSGQLAKELPKFTIPLEATGKNLEQSSEYKVAKKLESLTKQGERVFAPGNYGFFLNYFTPVAQLRGGLFQSSIHPWPDHIYYQVVNGASSTISLAWLKIANISWLVYTTGGSGDPFKDYKVPISKFDEILKRKDETDGDVFFKVPLVDSSLAKVVSRDIAKVSTPKNAIDKEPIFSYLSYLEKNPGKAKISFMNNQVYTIDADIKEGEVILVQLAFHKGWKAVTSQGKKLTTQADPLGFLLIDPLTSGEVQIKLTHGPILSQYLGLLVSLITLGFLGRMWLQKK